MSTIPSYVSHKTVQAFKISNVVQFAPPSVEREKSRYNDDPSAVWLLPEKGQGLCPAVQVNSAWVKKFEPRIGGYFVRYKDGYESFSPADAFEEGYAKLN